MLRAVKHATDLALQVYLSQVYSPTGDSQYVAAFLVPQYILLVIFMTVVIAYSIHIIF